MATSYLPAGKLTFTATEGSADAFVQEEIETGLQVANVTGVKTSTAYRIIEIVAKVTALPFVDGCYFDLTFTRQSKAATPTLADRTLIWAYSREVELATSGAFPQEQIVRWQPAPGTNVLIVENPIYVQLDSGATSLSMSTTGYILYEPVTVSEVDRLALLSQSLS